SPWAFALRSVDDPGVSLRTPLDSVKDSAPRPAAHTFIVYGLAPAVRLRARTKRPFPFLQLRSAFPADSLRVRWVPLFRSFRRLGAFALSTHPRVRGFAG